LRGKIIISTKISSSAQTNRKQSTSSTISNPKNSKNRPFLFQQKNRKKFKKKPKKNTTPIDLKL
jgi:hypothetical protein